MNYFLIRVFSIRKMLIQTVHAAVVGHFSNILGFVRFSLIAHNINISVPIVGSFLLSLCCSLSFFQDKWIFFTLIKKILTQMLRTALCFSIPFAFFGGGPWCRGVTSLVWLLLDKFKKGIDKRLHTLI